MAGLKAWRDKQESPNQFRNAAICISQCIMACGAWICGDGIIGLSSSNSLHQFLTWPKLQSKASSGKWELLNKTMLEEAAYKVIQKLVWLLNIDLFPKETRAFSLGRLSHKGFDQFSFGLCNTVYRWACMRSVVPSQAWLNIYDNVRFIWHYLVCLSMLILFDFYFLISLKGHCSEFRVSSCSSLTPGQRLWRLGNVQAYLTIDPSID